MHVADGQTEDIYIWFLSHVIPCKCTIIFTFLPSDRLNFIYWDISVCFHPGQVMECTEPLCKVTLPAAGESERKLSLFNL